MGKMRRKIEKSSTEKPTFLKDSHGRILDYLRISLTDKCNLDCLYCSKGNLMKKEEILTFEEIENIVRIFHDKFGIKKIRFTGGEPFLRRGVDTLIEKIATKFPNLKIGITTNGIFLNEKIQFLKNFGISANVSIDTLSSEKFKRITGSDFLQKVILGIEKAISNGIKVKLNSVPMKDINLDDIVSLVRFAMQVGVEIRFIELMPILNFDFWKKHFVPNSKVKEILTEKFAMEFLYKGKMVEVWKVENIHVGFISTVSEPFCNMCSRIRLTSDGKIALCLFDKVSYPIKGFLRPKFKEKELVKFIHNIVKLKPKGFVEIKERFLKGELSGSLEKSNENLTGIPMRMLGG